jgi:hypothetical protein
MKKRCRVRGKGILERGHGIHFVAFVLGFLGLDRDARFLMDGGAGACMCRAGTECCIVMSPARAVLPGLQGGEGVVREAAAAVG